jgi:hypothetical protein
VLDQLRHRVVPELELIPPHLEHAVVLRVGGDDGREVRVRVRRDAARGERVCRGEKNLRAIPYKAMSGWSS